MALDVQAICEKLVETITDGTERTLNGYPYVPESPRFPAFAVDVGRLEYHLTFGDNAIASLDVRILVGVASRAWDAMVLLYDMLSSGAGKTSSIVDALEVDKTLGGTVEQCWVSGAELLAEGDVNATVYTAAVDVHVLERRGA